MQQGMWLCCSLPGLPRPNPTSPPLQSRTSGPALLTSPEHELQSAPAGPTPAHCERAHPTLGHHRPRGPGEPARSEPHPARIEPRPQRRSEHRLGTLSRAAQVVQPPSDQRAGCGVRARETAIPPHGQTGSRRRAPARQNKVMAVLLYAKGGLVRCAEEFRERQAEQQRRAEGQRQAEEDERAEKLRRRRAQKAAERRRGFPAFGLYGRSF